ncbi:MAG TPA: tRNA (adenosine(37)-N6)-threonylcarbamoyltransferase complex ATPase subunit type 1 TsaE [Verrucomicrobiae bacterium]|nr:tRNA (adenosine(37)-N6)-threonylcarbamoyltransferase complex ATPase subunit type 1 TsaE [Verrucomicrobiae bacterium]
MPDRLPIAHFISRGFAETESLGESWGRDAQSGLVIAMSGDLGAGKTRLVKGFARGLGFRGRVHSPTFALVNVYSGGRLTIFHLDLYRLETREQILAAGLEEYLNPRGVALIEWAERLENENGKIETGGRLMRVKFEITSETERRISYEDSGA